MIRKQDKQKPRERDPMRDSGDLDWEPLYRALHDSIEWALDVAAKLAAPYPDEVEAIERVRSFVRAKLDGRPAQVRIPDLMLAFGILIAAIERDLPVDKPTLLAGGVPSTPEPILRIPAASELWEPTVTRYCPGAHTVLTRRMPLVRIVA